MFWLLVILVVIGIIWYIGTPSYNEDNAGDKSTLGQFFAFLSRKLYSVR